MTKYFTKKSIYLNLIMLHRYQTNDSSKLHQFVSFNVWVMLLLYFKLYSLIFANAHAPKSIVLFIRNWSYPCCIKNEKMTYHLKQAQKSISNLSNVNCLHLTKTYREIKCLVIYNLSEFLITFFSQISWTSQHIVTTIPQLVMSPH